MPEKLTREEPAAAVRSSSSTWGILDWVLLGALLLAASFASLRHFNWTSVPIEDAAMLLRYSANFAQGHGVRWNITDAPVDGATDFLYMASIAGLTKVSGLSVVTASRILNLSAQVLSVGLIFWGGRRVLGANRWVSAFIAAYLIGGPAAKMAAGCFGAPFFALMILGCWCAGLAYAERRQASWSIALLMATMGLLAGLTRPEGVIIAFTLLLATVYRTGIKNALPAVVCYAVIFAVLGGAYFIWRWKYFGYPLPNPFYIKGGGHLYFSSVTQAAVNLSVMLAPVIPLIALGWVSPANRRLANSLAIVLGCFTAQWLLLNNWNNHFMRFQYAIVPAVLLTVPGLLRGFPDAVGIPAWETLPSVARRCIAAAASLWLVASIGYFDREFRFVDTAHGMRDFAERLSVYKDRGYTMAVTEAGALPFYSQWRVIDGLGLNDSTIAHQGGFVTQDYLEQNHPQIVMVHADGGVGAEDLRTLTTGIGPQRQSAARNFVSMTLYAKKHGYELAAAFGPSPCNLHLYWIQPNFPDHDAVLHAIRDYPYIFLDNGLLSHDYRNELPAPAACSQ